MQLREVVTGMTQSPHQADLIKNAGLQGRQALSVLVLTAQKPDSAEDWQCHGKAEVFWGLDRMIQELDEHDPRERKTKPETSSEEDAVLRAGANGFRGERTGVHDTVAVGAAASVEIR